jgi:hypothetical protein
MRQSFKLLASLLLANAATALAVPHELVPPGTTWHLQLNGDLRFRDAHLFDVDLFDVRPDEFRRLQRSSRMIVCYFSAGTREIWRADAFSFPADGIGHDLPDWPGETWLDTRRPDVRAVMLQRLDKAVQRGCSGVDPDNLDAYTNDNGLGLTEADALDYARFLAREAHARGLAIGLKNIPALAAQLVDDYDWALSESCFLYDECSTFQPFLDANKAVFVAEYGFPRRDHCEAAAAGRFDLLFFTFDLDGYVKTCDQVTPRTRLP